MKTKQKSIGSFDAKTHLAHLLDEVQRGVEFIITKRGKPVARLAKYGDTADAVKPDEIIAQLDAIRNSVKGKTDTREYINEGRKY
ncbi:MAG TPA: type II toxin-antitoxin system prevent-host-death family antitoxin [Spirochaetota bacterium]|nr:type II toxin-antitoxin system prevent-host-death family antitoxin [Spirochaetota bacterium]HPC40570.1 type II toxin-antitoxin system prevent-host-death family antitoxin [Spirochaetota bacterium]HPL18395.1 type II toxin-antitoxin system prevent-host-death family antitoxin [Spirochaetota bacterium]HQF07922.1 type II toxin-antitoxin system prevent-host-death family antitoxin [Spirochaetota bacterium]HQH96482.1 type II toxin-antitoxin system prevent-host-death family antitoxin [Spirochaetota ba